MVNRVFCYSTEEAKKNGCSFSVGRMVLEIFILVIIMVITIFMAMFLNEDIMENPMLFTLFILVWSVIIIFYAISAGFKYRSQLMGFATDTNNNVFCAMKLNNGESFAIGGIIVGNVVDNILGDGDSALGTAAQAAGAALAFYSMDKSAKIMRNPEIISKMVENAETTTGAEVRQILKVHSCEESKKKVKVKCDYKIMRNGKVKYGKNITIYKTYNCFNELLNILKLKK